MDQAIEKDVWRSTLLGMLGELFAMTVSMTLTLESPAELWGLPTVPFLHTFDTETQQNGYL